jgi:manganese/zinc/iron transport system permease protein
MFDFWIILTGSLVVIPCALLGSFLMLRKMVMVGDAISHAVLPGIVISYLIIQDLSSIWLIFGASLTGMLATVLIEFFKKKAHLQNDASIGITFTWLFALGVILISVFTGDVDLDLDCVLFGQIEYIALSKPMTILGINLLPSKIFTLLFIAFFITLFVILFFKELQITTFDSGYAASIGVSVAIWHYSIMGLVSFVSVASFEAVGAILVVAFIAIPPATAYLLTKKLKNLLFLSSFFGVVSVIIGTFVANLGSAISTSGSIVVSSGVLFGFIFVGVRILNITKKKKIIRTFK